jgi:hypothetical protein
VAVTGLGLHLGLEARSGGGGGGGGIGSILSNQSGFPGQERAVGELFKFHELEGITILIIPDDISKPVPASFKKKRRERGRGGKSKVSKVL